MKKANLQPIAALALSMALALLGHGYLLYRPEYTVDAIIFYVTAALLAVWVYQGLDTLALRRPLAISVACHGAGLLWTQVGGSTGWLALAAGVIGVIVLAPTWAALSAPLRHGLALAFSAGGAAARHAPEPGSPARLAQAPAIHWRQQPGLIAGVIAFGLAFTAQQLLNPQINPLPGTLLYLVAAGILIVGLWRDRELWQSLPPLPAPSAASAEAPGHTSWRLGLIGLALAAALIAYLSSGGNRFTPHGVIAWLVSVGALILALWETQPGARFRAAWLDGQGMRLSWWTLLIVALIALGILFRFYQLDELPAEMNSDHAEKLLDVRDVLRGEYKVFFPRNTGREAWQFYWTAALVRWFHMPPDFQTLKFGAALVGALMLPGLYLLGAQVLGRVGGMWTLLFGAVTSWSVIPIRIGLRYAFMQMPAVWSLYFLARAARHERRNDFILMGLIWGIGFYGYQSYRAMALALPAAFLTWYVLSGRWKRPGHRRLWGNVAATLGVTGLILVPMIRFSIEYPEQFWTRILTRVTGAEQAIQGSPALIFADNVRRALLSFFWYGDEVWVAGLTYVPIIDPLLGALIVCGLAGLLIWSLRRQDALPAALVVLAIAMTGPSAAAIAFPRENPSAIRLGGMIPSIMTICATLPTLLLYRWWRVSSEPRARSVRWLGLAAAGLLAGAVVGLNWNRIFDRYAASYCMHSLNASEVAQSIKGFVRAGGPPENAFYVASPYWFDSRAIGIWLGDIGWPNTLLSNIETNGYLPVQPGPRLYILHPDDQKNLDYLRSHYPRGWLSRRPSQRCTGHDFMTYYVPPEGKSPE